MVLRVEKEREREYGAAHERTIKELEDLARRREAEFMSQTKTLHRLLQNNNNGGNSPHGEGGNNQLLPPATAAAVGLGLGPGQTPRARSNLPHLHAATPDSPHFFDLPGVIRGGLDGASVNNISSNMSSFLDCSEEVVSPIPLNHTQSSQQSQNKATKAGNDDKENDRVKQLEVLQGQIDQLTSELAATSAALSMTQSELSQLAMEKTKREAVMVANEEKIGLLSAKLQLVETEQTYLESSQIQGLQQELQLLKHENEQFQRLKTTERDLAEQLRVTHETNALLTTERDRLSLETSQQKSDLSQALQESSTLRQQLKEREQLLKERELASAESAEHIRLLGGQVTSFEKDLLAARARMQTLQQQADRLDDSVTRVNRLETKLAQTEDENNTAQAELLSRLEQKETLLQEQVKLADKWKKRMEKGTKELKEASRGRDKLERELLAQIDSLRSQIDSQEEEIADLRLDSLPSQQNCVQSRAGDMLSLLPFLQVPVTPTLLTHL